MTGFFFVEILAHDSVEKSLEAHKILVSQVFPLNKHVLFTLKFMCSGEKLGKL